LSHKKQHVFAIRLEDVPALKPTTIEYILNRVKNDKNVGLDSQRKDFLETFPEKGKVIEKVMRLI
jgi:hypothetical protein